MLMKYKKLILFTVAFLTLHQFFVSHAYAYIDPVTGSAALTLLDGAIAAVAVVAALRILFRIVAGGRSRATRAVEGVEGALGVVLGALGALLGGS